VPDSFEERFPGASESANRAVRALVETHDVITRFANEAMERHGLSPASRQALATIDGAGGALTQSEIAERLLTTPPSISSLVDTLERRGLVVRRRDARDRRRQIVGITSEGSALVRTFVPEAVALQTAVMSGLGEQERARLIRTLARIRDTTATLDGAQVVSDVAAAAGARRRRRPAAQPPRG
jgi:DNA-binding MarR family transcriptional regulator